MSNVGTCSICGKNTEVYECSNKKCTKLVCLDCSNDYTFPLIEYYMRTPSFPLIKCPNCGSDLKYTKKEKI